MLFLLEKCFVRKGRTSVGIVRWPVHKFMKLVRSSAGTTCIPTQALQRPQNQRSLGPANPGALRAQLLYLEHD